jgi:hypothetical protein
MAFRWGIFGPGKRLPDLVPGCRRLRLHLVLKKIIKLFVKIHRKMYICVEYVRVYVCIIH